MVGVAPQNPKPLFTRVDATVAFRWWDGAPRSDMNDDDFGVRWTGYLAPPVSGEYRLGAIGFNAFELYLDEKRIARFNNIHERGYEYAQVELEAGKLYALRLDFHHFVNDADIRLVWQKPGEDLEAKAMDAVRQAEAVVLFLGLSPRLEGEEMKVPVEGFSGGDRVTLSLPGVQEELLAKVAAAGKPVVLVLMNGSAVAVRQARDKVPAIIEAWYPGQAGGAAIADVLFGDYNPGGRLPVTFYESEAQLPPFNNYDMAGRTYRFFKGEPLFAFGHGLSYTRFTYSNLKLPASARAGEKLAVSVDVRNAGSMAGDEVVQVYLRQMDAPAAAPLRSLVGFQRIGLRPGEKRSVSFRVELPRTAAHGVLEISVGGQQPSSNVAPTTQVLTGRVEAGASERAAAGDLKVSVYATAGGVQRHLATPQGRQRAAEALRKIGATRIVLEGRRGDESVAPEALRELRTHLSVLGFETSGGIATVPGKSFGVRQQGGLSWLNWEAEAARKGVAEFFSSNARVFDELVVDDFYCTMDTSPESEKARAGRDWGEYRRDLLTGLIKPVMIEPARAANPRVRMVIKYPQWYDRFHLFGYDPARMSGCFDRVWVGTEVRNPKTQRMGFVQPTQGYINYRWLADLAGSKVEAAWFDHIECTAQNFVDQAWQSVLAGARELVLFNLMDVVSGHPGHELFVKALPEMRAVSRRIQGRPPDGVAYYKPAGSDPGENLFLMDYLAMLGIPVVPVSTYPASYRSVVLGVPAAHDPKLLDKVKAHLKSGARVAMTAALMERLKAPEGVVRLELKTFSEQDYRDAGEWLLPPKEPAWLDMPREKADALRKSLGVDLSAPPRIAYYRFGQEEAFYSFLDADAQVTLRGRAVKAPAHSLVWVER